MAGIDFSSLTPKNGAVQELAELIFLELIEDDKLGQLVTFMPSQENGKKLGFVGKAGLLGKKAKGCDPEYAKNLVQASEKTWDLQEWEIAEEICYKELEGTIAEYFAANGSDMADLTSSEYMEQVVRPILEQAIRDLMIRFAFFGDKNADESSLKEGVDPEYFTLVDGIFKQLFTGVTEGKTTRVTIEANTKTSVAEQYAAMKTPGAATGVLNDLIVNTPMKLRRMTDRVFIVTQAFADMLNFDIQNNNKGSELQWESIFAGIQKATYQGITIVAVPQFDEIIQEYLKGANANAYDKPFRVIYGAKGNFRVGSKSKETVADLKVTFDDVTRKNYIYAADTLGALVLAEEYAAVAY